MEGMALCIKCGNVLDYTKANDIYEADQSERFGYPVEVSSKELLRRVRNERPTS